MTAQTRTYNGAEQAFTMDGYTISYQQDGQTATPKDARTDYFLILTRSAWEMRVVNRLFESVNPGAVVAPCRDSCNLYQKQSGLPILVNPCKPVSTTLFCELAQWMMSGLPFSSLPTKMPTWESPG